MKHLNIFLFSSFKIDKLKIKQEIIVVFSVSNSFEKQIKSFWNHVEITWIQEIGSHFLRIQIHSWNVNIVNIAVYFIRAWSSLILSCSSGPFLLLRYLLEWWGKKTIVDRGEVGELIFNNGFYGRMVFHILFTQPLPLFKLLGYFCISMASLYFLEKYDVDRFVKTVFDVPFRRCVLIMLTATFSLTSRSFICRFSRFLQYILARKNKIFCILLRRSLIFRIF